MQSLAAEIAEAADVVRAQWDQQPFAGIVLGTGLGSLADQIETPWRRSLTPQSPISRNPRPSATPADWCAACCAACRSWRWTAASTPTKAIPSSRSRSLSA